MLSLPQPQTHRQLRLQHQLLRHPPWEPLGLRTLQLHPLLKPGLRRLERQRLHLRAMTPRVRLGRMHQRHLRRLLRQMEQQRLAQPRITLLLLLALLWKVCRRKLQP